MRVVNFGSLNIDYTYRVENLLRPGETKAAKSLAINCGGKGLNQSVALARAGACVYHASFVGPEGTFLVETLRESGACRRAVAMPSSRSATLERTAF